MARALDWRSEVQPAAQRGHLMALLDTLPRPLWTVRNERGLTLLHAACWGDNVDAARALLASGLDVDVADGGWSPAHLAADHGQPRMLQFLCMQGANMLALFHGVSPLDLALDGSEDCVRVLVANGVRLETAGEDYRSRITPELVAFERGVLRCRSAVVAVLRVKRAGKLALWDRFLLAHLALCVWCTRTAKEWARD